MMQDNPYTVGWTGSELYRMFSGQLGPSGLLLVSFLFCSGMALAATLRVLRDFRGRKNASVCPWKMDGNQSPDTMTRWVCSKCRSISFRDGNEPPRTCHAYAPRSKAL